MHGTCNLPLSRSLPLVCICSLFSFLCGVGIGANDLSANFAMVVGSGSLNMRQAVVYCTVFELLGAAFMGGRVSGTIRKGIVDPGFFTVNEDMVLIGMTCASFAAALWLYLSTVFGLPVSITHTVVGSIIGFAIFSSGSFQYIQMRGVVKIMVSWLLAPLAAVAVTAGVFYVLRKYVLRVKGRSFQNALCILPYCLGFSLLIDFMFVVIEQPPVLTVTLARFVPITVQYLIFLAVILVACYVASSLLFSRLAEEAWEVNSFVWESEKLCTEAVTRAAAGLAEAEAGDERLEACSFSLPQRKLAASDTYAEHPDGKVPLPQRVTALLHDSGSFFLSIVDSDNVELLPRQSVRAAPVGRCASRMVFPLKGDESETLSLTFPASYGTVLHAKDTTEGSPHVVDLDDGFMEEDWGIDHPMQPINFRGLLLKPFNPRAEYLFTALQVVAGSMSSFVHGAVAGANATAAFVILYDTFAVSELEEQPLGSSWAVLPAMLGIAIGMFTLGARLMKTVGMELVTVTPARGWCIQVGGTLVTMVLTGIGIPVSLSQAQVGAAIGCGLLDARSKGVEWGVAVKIVCGWGVTIAISAVTTGASMWLLAYFYCA
ncbi:putative phosphate transporter [Trypanosoma rangeli]|uniref:Phosphate transporter n=1 Tax=Trypanosoma rangeli TaxID=5698 RepID=A0A3R7L5P3_TRYRA|nr:putative phosphate transporter [Trypanosoma rangeli]RNF08150.1 putative phosphate transporter [Trypanosoma rangeli]|eukprot:RNF08150.1 putative phosphate transporter [Trypanosoma rangeli]